MANEGGDITATAKKLGVPPHELRRFSWIRPELIALLDELQEQVLDEAEAKLREAVRDPDWRRSDRAAMFLLSHHEKARELGYGPAAAGANVNVGVMVSLPTRPLPERHPSPPAISMRDEPPPDDPPPE